MFTHANFREAVLKKEGEYILYAKNDQARLRDDIASTFAAADGGEFPPKRTPTCTARR